MVNKTAKIPVASHGLHRHPYNYPWLSSINFGDVMPCYVNNLRKGEKDSPSAGVFSQLMPITHNAFATGRFEFKSVFVPFKFVWRPWYAFSESTDYVSNGISIKPTVYPYVTHSALSSEFIKSYCTFVAIHQTSDPFDITYYNAVQQDYLYSVNPEGRPILRILGALGCMPSFSAADTSHLNILPLMCYIKAFADYYYPKNYIGNNIYLFLNQFFDTDVIDFSSLCSQLLQALLYCSVGFYENSIFDLCWDNPVTPNVNSHQPIVQFNDVTDPNDDSGGSNVNNIDLTSGTPVLAGEGGSAMNAFSKYLLDALSSVSLWAKRHQLSGARILDRFLVSRGVNLSNDSARVSYYLGKQVVEIDVSAVENNTDTNLGELAGKGVASSGDKPLSFSCTADDDGIFLVIVSAIPDANFPVYLDGFANRQDFMDNYHAEFDKLGCAAVPARVVRTGLNGVHNQQQSDNVFGFLSQYWDELQEKPRLLGDFILPTQGSEQLSSYHTFRLFNPSSAVIHSFNFMRMSDKSQYQRLFYSDQQENLMLFLRWKGSQYKEKLPLGDSYDWDDDEFNKKVSVVTAGSQV